MPEIGPMEILLVAIVALLVFGPEKLPDMARTVGRTISQLRRTAQDMRDEFSSGLEDDYDEARPEDPDEDEDYVAERRVPSIDDEPADRPPEKEPSPEDPPDNPNKRTRDEPPAGGEEVPEYPNVRRSGRPDNSR